MAYKLIEDYGIIGDMHTAGLISRDGSLDWLCLPDFDSPSVFATLLDDEKGGYFRICGQESEESQTRQFYFPETNVLMTRFSSSGSVAQLADFMEVHEGGHPSAHEAHGRRIIRQVQGVQGTTRMRLECFPRFDYGRLRPHVEEVEGGVIFSGGNGFSISLSCDGEMRIVNGGVICKFDIEANESRTFVLAYRGPSENGIVSLTPPEGETAFHETTSFWRAWLSNCTYNGRGREVVFRSALTLKLLTYQPTSAIVAAPTCSLPEVIGGERNWDYRYTWMRDSSFILHAFMQIGLKNEAQDFMHFVELACETEGEDGPLNLMYTIRGKAEVEEQTLDHLDGYMGSRPVRVGNGAGNQMQLDIYGELMDAVYLFNKDGTPISYALWKSLRGMLNWLMHNWRRADEGIWEVRGGRQQFVHSKMMCWVAFERGIRIAESRSFPSDRFEWIKTRDEIYEEIQELGWSDELQSFTQYYGAHTLDASALLMPLVFFMAPQDPRMQSTIKAIEEKLTYDSLVYRYNADESAPDGLEGDEGTFTMCTFWLVEALTKAGRLDDARFLFERMLGYSNHLGLYSEEIGRSGESLGNFPQGFTHLGLISAAVNLDHALGGGRI